MPHPRFLAYKAELADKALKENAAPAPEPAGRAVPLMGPIAQKILAEQEAKKAQPVEPPPKPTGQPGSYEPVQPAQQGEPVKAPDWTDRGEPTASRANLTGNQQPTARQKLWGKSAATAAPAKPAPLMGNTPSLSTEAGA